MYAETNITLNIQFECPLCGSKNNTADHGLNQYIETSSHKLECPHCHQEFELVINEA
ncbi:hypothetical protein RND59_05555 [Vibrio ruber]|uniref:hypothetical protein n=1 Tax=Vibrio ruber TaxID=184755 RepID=UPI0028937B7A|nr:hypothetical protein [Vibrio ruber]WNJ96562.1 hypothetical protein RND59_05555 [Vibrio ruber]